MNTASHNQQPKRTVSEKLARFTGRMAAKAETNTQSEVNWYQVAVDAKEAPRRGEKAGGRIYFNEGIASVTTQAGNTRNLQGIFFAGREKYGLVTERAPGSTGVSKFLLTNIGEGQNSSVVLREVNIADLEKPRADGVVQKWQEISIGRANDNDVVTASEKPVDQLISRKHATLEIDANSVQIIDERSLNGTTYLSADQTRMNMSNELAEAWNAMNANPALWSGEYGGATVIPQ